MTPAEPATRGPADRKSVLFCPACEHEAPLDGDWAHDTRGDLEGSRTDLRCPECGWTVVSQPRFETRKGGAGPGDDLGTVECVKPVLQLLNAVVRHDVL